MVVQQSVIHRNQRIVLKALFATVSVALGIETYGIIHEEHLNILSVEYSIVFVAGFILTFTFVWLTAKRNIKITITQQGLEISHDEAIERFAWQEVKKINQPNILRSCWLFELNQEKTIKIPTKYFSKKQVKEIKIYINRLTTKKLLNTVAERHC